MKCRIALMGIALLVMASLLGFVACKKEAPPAEETWQWPDRLLLVVTSSASASYGHAVAWSSLLAKDTGMAIRVVAEGDSRLHELWVREGRLFSKYGYTNRMMLYGDKGYTRRDWGPWQSRTWMPAGLAYWGFTVLGDSSIKTLYDIKPGMKAVAIPAVEDPQQMTVGLLAWAKVDPKDITFIPASTSILTVRFLADRKADFTVAFPATTAWLEVEASPSGLRWLALDPQKDPEGAQRFLKWFPYTGFAVATGAGTPSSEGIPMGAQVTPMVTRADADTELVYRIVKWLDENYGVYKDAHPWCKTTTIDNLVKLAAESYEALHDGSVKYLQEKGLWTEALEARRQYNIQQLQKWIDAYQEAVALADSRGVVVNPDNADWQKLWEDYRSSRNLPLLSNFQGPGKEQLSHASYYRDWEQIKPRL